MEAFAGIEEQFGPGEGAEHHARFRAADGCVRGARVRLRQQRIDRSIVAVATPAERGAQPAGPEAGGLHEQAGARFPDEVAAGHCQRLAQHRQDLEAEIEDLEAQRSRIDRQIARVRQAGKAKAETLEADVRTQRSAYEAQMDAWRDA